MPHLRSNENEWPRYPSIRNGLSWKTVRIFSILWHEASHSGLGGGHSYILTTIKLKQLQPGSLMDLVTSNMLFFTHWPESIPNKPWKWQKMAVFPRFRWFFLCVHECHKMSFSQTALTGQSSNARSHAKMSSSGFERFLSYDSPKLSTFQDS